jgi:Zn finger protein HypA/HybF involved in hydrogenase expression
MNINTSLPRLKCKRCGHEWIARVENVRICPKCRSPYWDVEPIRKRNKDGNKKSL